MLIGERSAERIKIEAGSAYPLDEEETVEMRGRDLATGLPKVVELSTVEVRDSLLPVTNEMVQAVRSAIERTPPELVADLMMHGIAMGRVAARCCAASTDASPPRRASRRTSPRIPLRAVVRGCAEALEEATTLQKVQAAVAMRRPPR